MSIALVVCAIDVLQDSHRGRGEDQTLHDSDATALSKVSGLFEDRMLLKHSKKVFGRSVHSCLGSMIVKIFSWWHL